MNKTGKFLGILAIMTALSAMCFGTVLADEEEKTSGTICNGVYIEGFDMGGKTSDEAESIISEYVTELQNKKVIVSANDKTIETTMGSLGYKANDNEYVKEALNIGTFGNVIQRYKDLKDVEYGKKEYDIEFTYDESLIDKFITDNIEKCNIDAKEPSMKPNSSGTLNGSDIASQFTYSDGVTGKVVNNDDAIKKIKETLNKWNNEDVTIEPEVVVDEPKYTIDQLKKMDAMIGTFKTSFSTNQTDRCKNIANAASKVNGTIVYPGDTFSILKKITPITEANGYRSAGSYLAGKVVESVGGGVCQVSTTLYNAILNSELEIVKRNNHSMAVTYVDISFDAMIASSSGSDFKFKNNTDCPIYIEGYVSGGSITFNVYGKETRPSNRKIRFENEIIEEIQPGADVVTVDTSKPTSYYKVTQSAHTGYKAKLYKIVTVDGVETERVVVNSSTYKSTPKYITVGSAETTVAPNATADPNSDVSQDDVPIVDPVTPTQAPTETVPEETAPQQATPEEVVPQ